MPRIEIGTARLGMMVAEGLPKEDEDHRDHKSDGEHQRHLDVVNRFANRLRTVEENAEFHAGGHLLLQRREACLRMPSTISTVLVPGCR